MQKRFLLCFLYPMMVGTGIWLGGLAGWASIILGGTLYAWIDALRWWPFGNDQKANLPVTSRLVNTTTGHSSQDSGLGLLVSFAIVQIIVLVWALLMVGQRDYALWELVGITLSLSTLTGGIGFPVAHELIHRKDKFPRFIGLTILATVLYMHFRIEHIYGHHVKVGTPNDPVTARFNESLWHFLPRSILGQLKSAYLIEKRFLSQRKTSRRLPFNRLFLYGAIQLSMIYFINQMFGNVACSVFIGQALYAIMLLEIINYIEHYGLQRKKKTNGRYEPVSIHHSWNTNSFFTNSIAFNLGLHSDHHAFPNRSYVNLTNRHDAPQLPAGYLTLIGVACIPPLWRKLMNHRLPNIYNDQAIKD